MNQLPLLVLREALGESGLLQGDKEHAGARSPLRGTQKAHDADASRYETGGSPAHSGL